MQSTDKSSDSQAGEKRDRAWALAVASLTMALTLVPYLYGYRLRGTQESLSWYSWLTYDLADSSVYFSWIRQAADGHFFQRNLFTTEPQVGHQFNILFLVLGNLVRLTGKPLPLVYHVARLILGVAFLRAVWWLIELLVRDRRARWASFFLICFSSGLGWLPALWNEHSASSPVDTYQPEAITFLSLYFSPLLALSLLLMVCVIGWLLLAERAESYRYAVYAGLCCLLLGNVHTYDVITVGAVWSTFLVVQSVARRRWSIGPWKRALVAGLIAAASTFYQGYLVLTDPVFAKRAAVATPDLSLEKFALGYGLVGLLAIVGSGALISERKAGGASVWIRGADAACLLATWVVVNLVVTYLPLSFKGRLLMGEHIPLAILAAVGLTWCLQRLRGPSWALALTAAVLLLSLTNWRFLLRDMKNLAANRGEDIIVRPYMSSGEVSALSWVREHVPEDVPVQPVPWLRPTERGRPVLADITVASFTPALTGHPVHVGHWGETPSFGTQIEGWVGFMDPAATEDRRKEFLRRTGVRYLLFTQKKSEFKTPDFWVNPPPFLRKIDAASNADADVYEVLP